MSGERVPASFDRQRSIAYFKYNLQTLPEEYLGAEVNRLTLCYFCLSALEILDALDVVEKKGVIDWIYNLQIYPSSTSENFPREHSGFIGGTFLGGKFGDGDFGRKSCGHGHLAMTYTAIVSLVILGDDLSRLRKEDIVRALQGLQDENGNFVASVSGGERDLRFVYCAAVIARLLGRDDAFDKRKAAQFVRSCMNYDGGFGLSPGQESHGGAAYVAYASLVLMQMESTLSAPEKRSLVKWCLRRQSGGFQGRCNKLVDTCYSFWIGGTLQMLGNKWLDMIDKDALRTYLLKGAQTKYGGFSKVPGTFPDVLHSYFGLCGLSLIGNKADAVKPITAMFGLSLDAAERIA
jgi:geranylgeranyl transferase type-1 subunit beta